MAPNQNGFSRPTLAALLLLLPFAGACSGGDEAPPAVIRLTDPELMESVESDQWDVIGTLPFADEGEPKFLSWDGRDRWHTFLVKEEISRGKVVEARSVPDSPRAEEGLTLVIKPFTGVARIVPVQPDARILIECEGTFQPPFRQVAWVIQLPSVPAFSGKNRAGVLMSCIRQFGGDSIDLKPVTGTNLVRGTLHTKKDTRALLFLVFTFGKVEGRLARTRMACLDREPEPAAQGAAAGRDPKKALCFPAFIGKTVKPSLLIPPTTRVVFRKLALPEGAAFRCALGVSFGDGGDVRVRLSALEADGGEHEILAWSPEPGRRGWTEAERDLSDLAGRELQLVLTSEWSAGASSAAAAKPRICLGAPCILSRGSAAGSRGPSLILVSLDTLRYDHLGCYGYDRPVSPTLDALAGEGVRFSHAYAHAPFTLPSHVSLFTGLYPSVHGSEYIKLGKISRNARLMAEILADHGLVTAGFNGRGFMSHEFGFHRGFDLYCEVDPLGDRYLNGIALSGNRLADGSTGSLSHALDWVESMKDQRFFLFLHTFMVHDYLPPRTLAEAFQREASIGLEPGVETRDGIKSRFYAEGKISEEELAFLVDMYDAGIRAADEMVAVLLARLEALGLKENTLIVVTSDHGEEFLDHGDLYHLKTVYEEMIRVPLILRGPGIEGGREVEERVSQVDLLPTVLELLGIPAPEDLNGRSLVPLLEGREWRAGPVFAAVNMPGDSVRRCLIQDGWKYIEGSTSEALAFPAPEPVEIFHLDRDPRERGNLQGREPEREKGLKRLLDGMKRSFEEMQERLDLGGEERARLTPALHEVLRQQGYF